MTSNNISRHTNSNTIRMTDATGAFDLEQGLGEAERARLHERFTRHHVAAGETFIREGQPGDCLYVIRSGTAEVRVGGRVLARFGPGHVVGEMALLDHQPRNADVVAVANCLLDRLTAKDFAKLCRKFPALQLLLTRLVAHRLNWSGDDLLSRQIGPYQVVQQIGIGAMGWVFEAARANERVALKMLPHHLVQQTGFLEQFREEAAILRQMRHENIVTLHETLELYGTMFLAMEYVVGKNLREWIANGRPCPNDIRSLAMAVARALQAAHAQRIVHRDVKPTNVMIRTDGVVKLMDFGIAAPSDIEGLLHGTAFTPGYAAPEMFGPGNNNPSSDFYSLGVVIYELMTGTCPFAGEDMGECARLHRTLTPPPLRDCCATVPNDLDAFVQAALTKDPAERLPLVCERLKQWDRNNVPTRVSRPPAAQPAGQRFGVASPVR